MFGEKDDVGIAPDERELLTAAPNVTLVEIADTGHFALNQKPDRDRSHRPSGRKQRWWNPLTFSGWNITTRESESAAFD